MGEYQVEEGKRDGESDVMWRDVVLRDVSVYMLHVSVSMHVADEGETRHANDMTCVSLVHMC